LSYAIGKVKESTLPNRLPPIKSRVPRRVLTAWLNGAQAELIANAAVADNLLVVV